MYKDVLRGQKNKEMEKFKGSTDRKQERYG